MVKWASVRKPSQLGPGPWMRSFPWFPDQNPPRRGLEVMGRVCSGPVPGRVSRMLLRAPHPTLGMEPGTVHTPGGSALYTKPLHFAQAERGTVRAVVRAGDPSGPLGRGVWCRDRRTGASWAGGSPPTSCLEPLPHLERGTCHWSVTHAGICGDRR